MTQELLHSVIDILDSAHSHSYQLTDLLANLGELKQQVKDSASNSRCSLQDHFESLKAAINETLDLRLAILIGEIDRIENEALKPLGECEDVIQQGIDNAALVMEEGKSVLQNSPENNLEKIIKFKDNPLTKTLTSLPEIPSRSAVPCITVELNSLLRQQICDLAQREGKVIARAPVHITDIVERPGSVLVHWSEVDEDTDINEFCLQFSYGNIKSNNDNNASFHTAYVGRENSFIVKHLRTATTYSFRVCGRCDSDSSWSVYSIPTVAATSIPHYQWCSETGGYSTSNGDKTATRIDVGVATVLYSNVPSVASGDQITFRVLDAGEKSLGDGVGLAWSKEDETLVRSGAVFVNINGYVYVDGQEMKMRLPSYGKGSALTFQTEPLPSGKVRVSIQIQEKEVAFEWKVEQPCDLLNFASFQGMGVPLQRQYSAHQLYFAMRFTHEDWKVAVE